MKGKIMGRIISIANQKGGVGKTTTSINLSAALGEKGKKVLVIDSDPQGSTTLKKEIDYIKDKYDFIIIDCPPALSILTINSMTASNSVLVPLQCEYYALEGLSDLLHTVNLVQERLNPELNIEGVVFTMYDSRTNLSNQVVENVKNYLDKDVYKTIIPRNVRLAEAPSYGQPINVYDPKSAGAEAYAMLADEVIKRKDV